MSDHSPADTFADALHTLDSSGDCDPLCAQFADGAALVKPELDTAAAESTDTHGFWTAYRKQFDEISTEFGEIQSTDSLATLEWTSKGTLANGRAIEYAGVSILTLDGEGKVSRFATFYDTAAFLAPPSAG